MKGGQSGSLTRIAMMASGSLCERMKSSLRFWNYTRRFIVNLNSDKVLCRGVCIARFRDWRNV